MLNLWSWKTVAGFRTLLVSSVALMMPLGAMSRWVSKGCFPQTGKRWCVGLVLSGAGIKWCSSTTRCSLHHCGVGSGRTACGRGGLPQVSFKVTLSLMLLPHHFLCIIWISLHLQIIYMCLIILWRPNCLYLCVTALKLKSICLHRSAPHFDPWIQHSLITVTIAYMMKDHGSETLFSHTVVKHAYFWFQAWKNPFCAFSLKSWAKFKDGNT